MKTTRKIEKILKEHKKDIKKKYEVKKIGIFGSYIRGEEKRRSDLDILVEFEKNAKIDLLGFINLGNYLSNLLGRRVDLVEKKCLKPYIGRRILQEVVYV
ncbi:nucleotidyltransferase [Candidatus Desantisbacteria bacterium CG1_02_38_46]|uniref:Nucleotidyltransferase n=3 Tax=unclassified Candidatus Desantisiibacteriota TaxID=3106372 RepID=A0A2H9PE97_9BACT|nr:MAG: nucleotidyltransferase [Candidatus Desantisbacteria bacterium CG1_02_38_46]PIU52189.1 MAG: nucleotidyltransferase [Candidatus Desantisbacteria bacterium CG07_land_8_20_14_0_80_39_15]PIZ17315.1 MAG: nucleotidyltransferase [Candidatus Desantisbacteria bacterium CG_4_10_14_0_8_um_filter_39_17]